MNNQNNKLDVDIIITTDSGFGNITFDSNADCWIFNFKNKISLFAYTLWRLLKDDQIVLVSYDHGQKFGLPKPVDVVNEISDLLAEQKLITIKIKKNSADLILILTNNYEIEIFINSSGYDSYELHANKKQYIGMGRGEISIFNT
jgi:hypothetical protein